MRLKLALLLFSVFVSITTVTAQSFKIGHTSKVFFDSSRNRNVTTEIYYPAIKAGDNVSVSSGKFPVIIFGHGFLMKWSSYENFWKELVPKGYVICFATTETSVSPNHGNFGLDLRFLTKRILDENNDDNSLFHKRLNAKVALMGHSMGGGASFLAAENNPDIQALINFAAVETTPSAKSAVKNVTIPTLIFSGEGDCVAPPNQHQDVFYANSGASCKTQISIKEGGHCYFANDDLICSFGESACNPSISITRSEQHATTFDFLNLWLTSVIEGNNNSTTVFNDSLNSSDRITYKQTCTLTSARSLQQSNKLGVYPNPVVDKLNVSLSGQSHEGMILIYNIKGELVKQVFLSIAGNSKVSVSGLLNGIYSVHILTDSERSITKLMKISE